MEEATLWPACICANGTVVMLKKQQERRIMMFKILLMPNTEKFLSLVKQSCGDVLLHLPDGSQCSLKRDHTARQMLRAMQLGRDGISISLSNPNDTVMFLRYMAETAL